MAKYMRADDDMVAFVQSVRERWHPQLEFARIGILMRSEAPESKGRLTLGKAKKATEEERLLSREDFDFIIWFAQDQWEVLTEEQRTALVDHELCFPASTRVTGPQVKSSIRRWYSGKIVTISTASGYFLAGTPNHPILTDEGWVPMKFLKEGSYVLSSRFPERVAAAMNPNEYQMPTSIEKIARPRQFMPEWMARGSGLVPQAAHDLYAKILGGEIDIVPANGVLLDSLNPALGKHLAQVNFGRRDAVQISLARQSHLLQGFSAMSLPAPSLVSGGQISRIGVVGIPIGLGKASIPDRNSIFHQTSQEDLSADGKLFSERIQRSSPGVFFDKLVDVRKVDFSNHVYNLETVQGWYIANHIITHNCHCSFAGRAPAIRPHDIEEFDVVIKRHGLWWPGAEQTIEAVQQHFGFLGEVSGGGVAAIDPEAFNDQEVRDVLDEAEAVVEAGDPVTEDAAE